MITGAHVILCTTDPDGLRDWFRDVLGFPAVDAGSGWLIFALPPSEVAIHPAGAAHYELYLMCDDLQQTMAGLTAKGVTFGPVTERRWGLLTSVHVPGGDEIGLYEPRHPSPAHAR